MSVFTLLRREKGLCLWERKLVCLFFFTMVKNSHKRNSDGDEWDKIRYPYILLFLPPSIEPYPAAFCLPCCKENIQHYYRPQSEGDNVLGSVHPFVRLSVCPSVRCADAVDRLLIWENICRGRTCILHVLIFGSLWILENWLIVRPCLWMKKN